MKIRIALNLLFLILSSCGIQDGRPNGVFIRVQNNSDVNFTGVIVQSGNVEKAFGSILARSKSDYKEFEYAFKYAAVWLQAEGQGLSMAPNDYTGEMPLKNGYYTYKIGLSSANLTDANLVFELVRD
ncbi:MAG: hypothetical protein Q8S14_04755 [Algoriphagus sp.]|jgi:hypothetical protein|uniref:hypothetical protein n=2 Tax=Algoriphagus sp. TaxID=1872435 RepID=UPI00272F9FEC|nr:hypothetical protein [Algoriphagus sp.]MDP2040954.1 hypothetical protein [Algoriphagus sp.]MDP3199721.1 hypothetical protein [Algoriphagus sp.]MDP3471165.1 hypothetical protein [Algoriphagus sp.]